MGCSTSVLRILSRALAKEVSVSGDGMNSVCLAHMHASPGVWRYRRTQEAGRRCSPDVTRTILIRRESGKIQLQALGECERVQYHPPSGELVVRKHFFFVQSFQAKKVVGSLPSHRKKKEMGDKVANERIRRKVPQQPLFHVVMCLGS